MFPESWWAFETETWQWIITSPYEYALIAYFALTAIWDTKISENHYHYKMQPTYIGKDKKHF